MGATNSTLNYHLSQFISTDKPAWLQDYNGDMEKIDVGINAAKVAADTAQNTANSAVSSIGTVTSDITSLQTDVLAHTNDITDLQGDVNTIESLIGNGTPTAGDHTLIGAINTNTSDIADLNSDLNKNNIGTGTRIESYTSLSTPFIAPSDGWISLYTSATGHSTLIQIYGADATSTTDNHISMRNNTGIGTMITYVKKGMKLFVTDYSTGDAPAFYPLV